MDDLRASYKDDDDDDTVPPAVDAEIEAPREAAGPESQPVTANGSKGDLYGSDDLSIDELSEDNGNNNTRGQNAPRNSPNFTKVSETEEDDDDEEEDPPPKKQKQLGQITSLPSPVPPSSSASGGANPSETPAQPGATKSGSKSGSKKSKKKNNNVWTRPTSRKGKKKNKNNGHPNGNNGNKKGEPDDKVLITPITRFPDRNDDGPDLKICLSKVYKAEKVELSEDRLGAGSIKGYRMVRATRGVVEGAWYFEIKVVHLGETGHTRLGWSTEKGDLQAPVGYDGNSFGYRDIDGCKVHKALREKYGEVGYKEGDVIGFYVNLPEGNLYAPDPPRLVWYKGQRYASAADAKEVPPKVVPGSEISFFKNGVCQGTAFRDLYGGRYYPAASMYTLPNQPNCTVKFNFGPDFECFPEDFGGRSIPKPMIEVPYHGLDVRLENGCARSLSRMCPMFTAAGEQGTKEAA